MCGEHGAVGYQPLYQYGSSPRVWGTPLQVKANRPEIRFIPGEESASFTEQSVSNLLGNVGQALVLASIILFFFLGRVRSSLVTILSMPLSYGISFGVMNALGMELNMVTLSAVILAVGMVVDATVVVLENRNDPPHSRFSFSIFLVGELGRNGQGLVRVSRSGCPKCSLAQQAGGT